jgi:hypothetical protein
MRITKLSIGEKVKAEIKVSLFKSKSIEVPTIHVAYMFNDPKEWDEIDRLSGKELMRNLCDATNEMMNENQDVFIEILLKVAGEHPNSFENEFIRKMLTNREFAIQQSNM